MKQYLLLLALALSLNTAMAQAQGKHRHHSTKPSTEAVAPAPQQTNANATATAKDANATAKADANKGDKGTPDEGIEAYSDTTCVPDTAYEDTTLVGADSFDDEWDANFDNDANSFFRTFFHNIGGGAAIVLAIVAVIAAIFFVLLPIIIVIWVLRTLIKQHNRKIDMAQKAMESGQPMPEELTKSYKMSREYQWQRGIKNTSIGAAFFLIYLFGNGYFFAICGSFMLCYGIGQMVIAKSSVDKNKDEHPEF